MDEQDIIAKLEQVRHYECGDSWYCCPQSDEGCANELKGSDCDCWAPLMHEAAKALREATEEIKILREAITEHKFKVNNYITSKNEIVGLVDEDLWATLEK